LKSTTTGHSKKAIDYAICTAMQIA